MLGPDHPNTLNARNSLASAYLADRTARRRHPATGENADRWGGGCWDADHPEYPGDSE